MKAKIVSFGTVDEYEGYLRIVEFEWEDDTASMPAKLEAIAKRIHKEAELYRQIDTVAALEMKLNALQEEINQAKQDGLLASRSK